MAVLGRLLQVVGWLWLAVGFLGPIVNLPIDLDIFPGIILVFVARILRTQAARNAPAEQEEATSVGEQAQPRVLNTERSAPRRPPPEPRDRPTPEPVRSETPKPPTEAKRQEMLEQILVAGTEVASEPKPEDITTTEMEEPSTDRPMSSAEMVAQARKRWNKRP